MEINEKEIAFSQAIKAGKRIYYLDVKKSKKSEMYLTITESKKIVSGEGDDSQVSFEKHKIFLYKEDFEKFMNGLQQSIRFIEEQEGLPSSFCKRETTIPTSEENNLSEEENGSSLNEEIKIDIDF